MAAKATIGSLIVNVLANVNPFAQGIGKGAKKLSMFERQVRNTEKTMKSLKQTVFAVGAAVGASKLAGEFLETAQAIDSLAKTSDKLGITTQKLAALRFAGEQTGVAVQTMDMALQGLTRRLAEAAKGTGEAKEAFKELGLDAQKLASMDPADAFKEIAGAMAGVPIQADRVRLAFKLFESEGVSLVNTLALGKSGLSDLERQAQSLGITISREEAAKVEAFNDALNSLSKLIGGLKSDIVIRVAPEATKFVDGLMEAVEGFRLGAGQSDGSLISKKQWPWTTELIKGLKGEFEWQKRWTDSMVGSDIRSGIAGTTSAQAPTVPRLSQAEIDKEESLGRVNKLIGSKINSALNTRNWEAAVGPVFKSANEALEKAKDIGIKSQREFMLNAFKPTNISNIFDQLGKESPEAQTTTSEIFRGVNTAIQDGTIEAARSEMLRNRDNQLPRMQLTESKRQTELLTKIETKITSSGSGVTIVEGGL